MKLSDGIRKHGFRKWYERELLQSHAHMVLAFLCMIAAMAAFELLSEHHNVLVNMTAIVVATVVGALAVRRYVMLLSQAEAIASQADCPGCGTYARFTFVSELQGDDVRVHCRTCDHEWTICPL